MKLMWNDKDSVGFTYAQSETSTQIRKKFVPCTECNQRFFILIFGEDYLQNRAFSVIFHYLHDNNSYHFPIFVSNLFLILLNNGNKTKQQKQTVQGTDRRGTREGERRYRITLPESM